MTLIDRLFEMSDLAGLLRSIITRPATPRTVSETPPDEERARREVLFELLSRGQTAMHNESDLQALMIRYPRHF